MNLRRNFLIMIVPLLVLSGVISLLDYCSYTTHQAAVSKAMQIDVFANAFRDSLKPLKPGWKIAGDTVTGPEGAVLHFVERHAGSEGHVDIEFELDSTAPASPRLLDCVSGFGSTLTEKTKNAAHLWTETSGKALLELKYSRKGGFASHYRGTEPKGLHGWHSICSPIIGFGDSEQASALQKWWVDHESILPAISPALKDLSPASPHGIKIFFGGEDTAEVRVDGEVNQQARAALLALGWPKSSKLAFVRAYVIAIHPE